MNKVFPWKQNNEEKKTPSESPCVSPRKQLLTASCPADGRIVKIYLSESHSEMMTGAPSAPPGTPTAGTPIIREMIFIKIIETLFRAMDL